jgi:hypothetical protein
MDAGASVSFCSIPAALITMVSSLTASSAWMDAEMAALKAIAAVR